MFKGVKPGDVIEVATRAEAGYAIATGITSTGVTYEPIGGEWQRGRMYREPATSRQIKTVFRRLGR